MNEPHPALLSRRELFRFLPRLGLLAPLAPWAERGFAAPAPREAASSRVLFTDVAPQAGLSGARNVSGSPSNKQFLIEEMGGGVALFDFDNDGWLDIFLVNGTTLDTDNSGRKPTSFLFRNNRD